MIKNFLIGFTLMAIAWACEEQAADNEEPLNGVVEDPEMIASIKNQAVDRVVINDQEFFLDVVIWRDYMPVAPPDGQPMIAAISFVKADSSQINATIDLNKSYIISGDEMWISEIEQRDSDKPYIIEGSAREGPKWGPDIPVDVVVEGTVNEDNETFFIIQNDVMIESTH